MRIVGGQFRGRPLIAPKDNAIRPTSDRVREALFNILEHGVDWRGLEGARVLDLFAGTGALGLEALSRGAAYCLFVEDDADARGIIRENVEALGLTGASKVWRRDATRLGSAIPMPTFQLVFADPPYGKGFGEKVFAAVAEGGWLDVGGIFVLEERVDVEVALPEGYVLIDRRVYGDTALMFFSKRCVLQP